MALKGTLKDFGIGDILQLIGQQQKTGMLQLRSREQEVHIGFKDGSIVKVESSTRKRKDLIGAMLVRAGLLGEEALQRALETQQRTLKRLGDVLVTGGLLEAARFRQMVQLQATETLYRLFTWKSGTYEFVPREVEPDADAIQPLRAESVLMEGFRILDEWPLVRKVVRDPAMTFQRLKELPPPAASGGDDLDDSLDDAFGEQKPERQDEGGADAKGLGEAERRLFTLVQPGRDVTRLVELSCLGEFEACKALASLVTLGYLEAQLPQGGAGAGAPGAAWRRGAQVAGRVALTSLLLAALALVGSRLPLHSLSLGRSPASTYSDPAAQRLLWHSQRARIEAALEVFALERGELPEALDALVAAGLLGAEDLRYPWQEPAYYRRLSVRQFVLLPPLR